MTMKNAKQKPARILIRTWFERHGINPVTVCGKKKKEYRERAASAKQDPLTGFWTVLETEPDPRKR